ncbi:hypothetical protein DPMN_026871 [Dreissena polymorpha]|uniref:Uncharacterized protein n=1 Tax=Dreissena polymorpha TaxID=45954 RepID=A0A9D4RER1_DREPO|nr:hypothetical protein DPMN_026871 [Dreissena polymorpha]
MLTEFSSVVANTQQYIVAGEEGETSEHEAEITEHEAADHVRVVLSVFGFG